jgi:tetratricopeptide (TPR) repeat protein
MQYDGGLVAEDPATTPPWGWQTTPYYAFKGPGTVSAQRGVFDNTVRLNDHVFDRAFDGKVRPEDAANFGDRRNLGMGEMAQYIERERHLPTIKGRSDWNREGSFSLGDLANQLWTTTETQSLYLTELHDRLNLLELLTNDRPVTEQKLVEMLGLRPGAKAKDSAAAQVREAIDALKQNVKLQPMSPYGFYQLGMTYHHLGEAGDAWRTYEQLKLFEPKYAATLKRDLESIKPQRLHAANDDVVVEDAAIRKEVRTAST